MTTLDMDLVKEIPGYKVILRAVLKSQIQQLVDQLAQHTDEEAVILTASVSDGTLCHLGSDSGKFFLEGHEDIKSQFLGFCLKRHHKLQQEERDRDEALRSGEMTLPGYGIHQPAQRFMSMRSQRMPLQRHPATMTSSHSPGLRHEPYPRIRPVPLRMTSTVMNQSAMMFPLGSKHDGQIIKIEQEDSDSSNQSTSDGNTPKTPGQENASHTLSQSIDPAQVKPDESKNDSEAASDSDIAVTTEGLGLQSELPNIVSDMSDQPGTSGSATEISGEALDTDSVVKLEAISESEMDLEITGMEPGRSVVSQENWTANVSMDMNFDQTGVTGMQSDLQGSQQGYTQEDKQTCSRDNICKFCGRNFSWRSNLRRHMELHVKTKEFQCTYCDYKCGRKDHLKAHMAVHLKILLPPGVE